MTKYLKYVLTTLCISLTLSMKAQSEVPLFIDTSSRKLNWNRSIIVASKFKLPKNLHYFGGAGLFKFKISAKGKTVFVDFIGHLPDIAIKSIKQAILNTCCWKPAMENDLAIDSKLFYLPVTLNYPVAEDKLEKEILINIHEEYKIVMLLNKVLWSKVSEKTPFIEISDGYLLAPIDFEFFHPKQ